MIFDAVSVMPITLPLVTYDGKGEITPGNVTVGNVSAMLDNGWQDLTEGWERLRWARIRWQTAAGAVNGNAEDAAASLGMKPGTYRAYERPSGSSKSTPLNDQAASLFGRRFKVNWIWLLRGTGTPFDERSDTQERIDRAVATLDEADQAALLEMAEVLAKRAAKRG